MLVARIKKALCVTSDSGRVEVKADYESGRANIQFDDVEIETNVKTLDELIIVLATLEHYAEMLNLNDIEGVGNMKLTFEVFDKDVLVRVNESDGKVTVGCNGNYLHITAEQLNRLSGLLQTACAYALIAGAKNGE